MVLAKAGSWEVAAGRNCFSTAYISWCSSFSAWRCSRIAFKSCRFDRTTRRYIDFWRWRIFRSSGVLHGLRGFISLRKDATAGATVSNAVVNFSTHSFHMLSMPSADKVFMACWSCAGKSATEFGFQHRFVYFCGSVSYVESLFARAKVAKTKAWSLKSTGYTLGKVTWGVFVRTPIYASCELYNGLPKNIKSSHSLGHFKRVSGDTYLDMHL